MPSVTRSETAPRRSGRSATKAKTAEVAKTVKAKVSGGAAAKKRKRGNEDGTAGAKKSRTSSSPKDGETESPAEEEAEKVAAIDIGGSLPELVLKNEKEEDVQVSELAKDNGVVLFLVPKADTPGCTNQACGFRDIYPDFTGVSYDVYCLSADKSSAQEKWKTKKELPYGLLSDPKRELIKALGAGPGGKTLRSHFIFEKGGKLVDKKNPVKPADSPKLAIEFIKKHSGSS